MERTTVLAMCGSLRADSLHRALLTAVADRAPGFRFIGDDLLRDLPLYDPALDTPDRMPSAARELRLLAEAAKGAVISSPEYVHAPSGVTTNALTWLTGSTGLDAKPVLLMSASPGPTGGLRGLAGLVNPVVALNATLIDPVSVSHAPSRIRPDGTVVDPRLDLRLEIAVEQLADAMSFAAGYAIAT